MKNELGRALVVPVAIALVAAAGIAWAQPPGDAVIAPEPEAPMVATNETTLAEYVQTCLRPAAEGVNQTTDAASIEELRAMCVGPLPEQVVQADNETFARVYLEQAILYDEAKIQLLSAAQESLSVRVQQQAPQQMPGMMPGGMFQMLVQTLQAEQQSLAQVLQEEYGAEAPTLAGTGLGQVVEADVDAITNQSAQRLGFTLLDRLSTYQAAQMDAAETAIGTLDNSTTEDAAVDVLRTHAQLSGVEQLIGAMLAQMQSMMTMHQGSAMGEAPVGAGPMGQGMERSPMGPMN